MKQIGSLENEAEVKIQPLLSLSRPTAYNSGDKNDNGLDYIEDIRLNKCHHVCL